jgi:hypothetical protein
MAQHASLIRQLVEFFALFPHSGVGCASGCHRWAGPCPFSPARAGSSHMAQTSPTCSAAPPTTIRRTFSPPGPDIGPREPSVGLPVRSESSRGVNRVTGRLLKTMALARRNGSQTPIGAWWRPQDVETTCSERNKDMESVRPGHSGKNGASTVAGGGSSQGPLGPLRWMATNSRIRGEILGAAYDRTDA